jgi:hypothetical protein
MARASPNTHAALDQRNASHGPLRSHYLELANLEHLWPNGSRHAPAAAAPASGESTGSRGDGRDQPLVPGLRHAAHRQQLPVRGALVAAPAATARQIIVHLGLEPPERLPSHTWRHQRQAVTLTDEWAARYRAELANSRDLSGDEVLRVLGTWRARAASRSAWTCRPVRHWIPGKAQRRSTACALVIRQGPTEPGAIHPDYDSDPKRWKSWQPRRDVHQTIARELSGPTLDAVAAKGGLRPYSATTCHGSA